jgi:hypothetical protein
MNLYWNPDQTHWFLLFTLNSASEPEFLKILKCNFAESASAGVYFNCFDIFNDKTLNKRLLDHLSGLLKCIQKNLFYQQTKTKACLNPVVLSDLWKDGSSQKVDFSPPEPGFLVISCVWRKPLVWPKPVLACGHP